MGTEKRGFAADYRLNTGPTWARQMPPEQMRAFPYPIIAYKSTPFQCTCAVVFNLKLGGADTPFVLKYFDRACPIHMMEARTHGNLCHPYRAD